MRSPGKSASNRLMEKTGSSTYGFFLNVHFQLLEYAFPAQCHMSQKIRITSPLTVLLKHGQLDFSIASNSISHYLISILKLF